MYLFCVKVNVLGSTMTWMYKADIFILYQKQSKSQFLQTPQKKVGVNESIWLIPKIIDGFLFPDLKTLPAFSNWISFIHTTLFDVKF